MNQETLGRAIELKQKINDLKSNRKRVQETLETNTRCLVYIQPDGYLCAVPLIEDFSPFDVREMLLNYEASLVGGISKLEQELEEL